MSSHSVSSEEKHTDIKQPKPTTNVGIHFFAVMQKQWLIRCGGAKSIKDRLVRLARLKGDYDTAVEARIAAQAFENECKEKFNIMEFFCQKDKVYSTKDAIEAQAIFKEARTEAERVRKDKLAKEQDKLAAKSLKKRARMMDIDDDFC
jgi:hypothetical protein